MKGRGCSEIESEVEVAGESFSLVSNGGDVVRAGGFGCGDCGSFGGSGAGPNPVGVFILHGHIEGRVLEVRLQFQLPRIIIIIDALERRDAFLLPTSRFQFPNGWTRVFCKCVGKTKCQSHCHHTENS